MRVFLDSDVVISSLLSNKGAAYILFHTPEITRFISTISFNELRVVCKRLDIQSGLLETLIQKKCSKVIIHEQSVKSTFLKFVSDPNDAHIVAGAAAAKATHLISYNLKHFKKNKIKDDLDMLLMTPAMFLQYLRSN